MMIIKFIIQTQNEIDFPTFISTLGIKNNHWEKLQHTAATWYLYELLLVQEDFFKTIEFLCKEIRAYTDKLCIFKATSSYVNLEVDVKVRP